MGADKSAENTPNAPKFVDPICLHKPKSLGFSKKNSLCVSVVRVKIQFLWIGETNVNAWKDTIYGGRGTRYNKIAALDLKLRLQINFYMI